MARERKGSVINRDGAVYARVRFKDETGKVRTVEVKAKNRTDARQILKHKLRELEDRGPKLLTTEKLTFRQLVEAYSKHRLIPAEYHTSGSKITKIAGVRSLDAPLRWARTLKEFFGDTRLRSLTYESLLKYKMHRLREPKIRGGQRSITSVNREMELLRAMLRFAVRERMIPSSPFNDGDPLISKSDETKRERVLTHEEEQRLISVCVNRKSTRTYVRGGRFAGKQITSEVVSDRRPLGALIVTALDTGMRKGELLKLKWLDVDLATRQIDILAFNTKTAKGRRVGMTARVYAALSDLSERSDGHPDSLVFGIQSDFKRGWSAALKDAEISDLKFHDLRHTAITRMVQSNISPAEVMKISGHTQFATFARYVNPDGCAVRRIADALDSFNSASTVGIVDSKPPVEQPIVIESVN